LPLALAEVSRGSHENAHPDQSGTFARKEVMFAELREVRGRTLALIEETRSRDLSVYRWRHPFLGSLNAYEWFSFFGLAPNPARKTDARKLRQTCPRLFRNRKKKAEISTGIMVRPRAAEYGIAERVLRKNGQILQRGEFCAREY